MKIFFMSSTSFGKKCLDELINMDIDIIGCAYTDEIIKQKKHIKNSIYVNFSELAKNNNIKAIYFDNNSNEQFTEKVRELNPDLILVAGFHYIIGKNLIDIPRLGVLGLHASLLPKYRGCAPLVWQLINGEKEGGISLFYIVKEGIDSGNIVGQYSFEITDEDTIKTMIEKSEDGGIKLIKKYLPMIANGSAPSVVQDDSKSSYFGPRTPEDGEINWNKTAAEVRNFIRAQTKPYPGAFTYIKGKKVHIWDADIIDLPYHK